MSILIVWGRAPSPVQAEQSSAIASGHADFAFAVASDVNYFWQQLSV